MKAFNHEEYMEFNNQLPCYHRSKLTIDQNNGKVFVLTRIFEIVE